MKSIFVSESPYDVERVYSLETIKKLEKIAGLDKRVFTKEEILSKKFVFDDVDYIFSTWGMTAFTEEEIAKIFPKIKALFYAAGSVQTFARPFLNRGIKVFSAWAANAVPVAEYTLAQILLSNKSFFHSSTLYRNSGHSQAHKICMRFPGNYGETVGIIGAGMIGKLVIKMLKQYNLNCIVFDPFLSDEDAAELSVQKCSLEEVFEKSFVVSNHLANNEQTKGMLKYTHFSSMRENATFINTGRGAQVVEEDLVRALTERQDIVAVLDVTDPEPPLDGHPFYTLPNCYLTPHIAGSMGDEVHRMSEYMLNEFEKFISGDRCDYEVTLEMLKSMA